MWYNVPANVIKRYDGSLQTRVWISHRLQEGLGDDDSSAEICVVNVGREHWKARRRTIHLGRNLTFPIVNTTVRK